jgi:enamine deaminase RidA (YjgF/YER057c/UK114 family)
MESAVEGVTPSVFHKASINPGADGQLGFFPDSADSELSYSEAVVTDFNGVRWVFCSGATGVVREPAAEASSETEFELQVRASLEKLGTRLTQAGGSFNDVVRIRAYVTVPLDATTFSALHRIRSEFFHGSSRPASTLLVVSQLARQGALVEFDIDAVYPVPQDEDAQQLTESATGR